ncbi:MAG: 2-hydroxyacid dehydrogenase, partial [Clostridia bacterium]|nr:2-hydroxyacid dehydrogenase [Clostridia bacterium]
MKILFYDTKQYDRDSFEKTMVDFPDITVDFLKTDISHRTVDLAKGYDAVCVFVASDVSREIVKKLGEYGVRLILLRCAGFNNVDLEEAAKQNITVMRVPGYAPEAVAEHALAIAFAVNRHIHKAYIKVRENNFSLVGLTGFNFKGKTAGIIGTGKIGAEMARFCHGIGMKVIAYDMYKNPDLDFVRYVELDELFRNSDLIS